MLLNKENWTSIHVNHGYLTLKSLRIKDAAAATRQINKSLRDQVEGNICSGSKNMAVLIFKK